MPDPKKIPDVLVQKLGKESADIIFKKMQERMSPEEMKAAIEEELYKYLDSAMMTISKIVWT